MTIMWTRIDTIDPGVDIFAVTDTNEYGFFKDWLGTVDKHGEGCFIVVAVPKPNRRPYCSFTSMREACAYLSLTREPS